MSDTNTVPAADSGLCGSTWLVQHPTRSGNVEVMAVSEVRAAIAAERAKSDALKTVMIAAAEEIAAHWNAHCDAEGYGPQNLMRRLEEGIPSEYGYTAGRFAEMRAELSALREQLAAERAHQFRAMHEPDVCNGTLTGDPPQYTPACVTLREQLAEARAVPEGWTDADADAARLALELECLLTDRDVPMPALSRWWDSAHEALRLHRERLAATPSPAEQPISAARAALSEQPEGRCYCDERGIGEPGVTCGDCPRDYGHRVATHPAPVERVTLSERRITEIVRSVVSSTERPIGMVAYGELVARAVITEYERINGIAPAHAQQLQEQGAAREPGLF